MIKTKKDLEFYLQEDKKRYGDDIESLRKKLGHSEQWYIWKFIKALRKLEYYKNNQNSIFGVIRYNLFNIKFHKMTLRTGFHLSPNVFGPGLYIPHIGTIMVSGVAKVGKNCCLRPGVMIPSSMKANSKKLVYVEIGDNVEFSEGCKILCHKVGDNVRFGPNVVVTRNIPSNSYVVLQQPVVFSNDF